MDFPEGRGLCRGPREPEVEQVFPGELGPVGSALLRSFQGPLRSARKTGLWRPAVAPVRHRQVLEKGELLKNGHFLV